MKPVPRNGRAYLVGGNRSNTTARTRPRAKLPVMFTENVAHGNDPGAAWISWPSP